MTMTLAGDEATAEDKGAADYHQQFEEDLPVEQLYWQTKTEMLSIYEEDLQLKLEIKQMKKQFLTILQNFKEFDNCDETKRLHMEETQPQGPPRAHMSGERVSLERPQVEGSQEKPGSPTDSESQVDSNNSSLLSEVNPTIDSVLKQEYIQRYFTSQQMPLSGSDVGSQPQAVSTGSLPAAISTGSSYGDLTAPNQTAASESTSNWDNVYINNLSKQAPADEVQYDTTGTRPKKLKVYIQNIPWDTSSDSSYNLPYPNTKPQLHPELQKALAASRSMKSTSSMESSLANISDITKYSEMSSRWIHSQNEASDYNSCSMDDLPHQSTPTKDCPDDVDMPKKPMVRRMSPTGGHVLKENQGQFATPVNQVQGSDICSSLDDSTPIVVPRTRRHLFPGEDSGITGSASDYTSSPSTMRENSNHHPGPKMDRDQFLLMDDNRSFNYRPSLSDSSRDHGSRQRYLHGQEGVSLEVTRDSEANVDDITTYSPPGSSVTCDRTSSSSNVSPMHSGVSSSYKESDGKASPLAESIDMALRTTIDGEESYNKIVANMKATQSVEKTPTNRNSSSTRPPCIGKEATPENNVGSGSRKAAVQTLLSNSPRNDLSKMLMLNNNNENMPGRNIPGDGLSSHMTKPPLPGYEDLRNKAMAPPEKPSFTPYDGGDVLVPPVVVSEEDPQAREVIHVDQYEKNNSPSKDGKKKNFFKKLKGFRKHFRTNSRSKAYVKND